MTDGSLLALSLLAGGVLTFATRAVFLLGGRRFHPGPRFQRLLAYVPPAVLAALIAPELLMAGGEFQFHSGNLRLWAGLAAAVVAWRTRSVLATIATGLLVLWSLSSPFLSLASL